MTALPAITPRSTTSPSPPRIVLTLPSLNIAVNGGVDPSAGHDVSGSDSESDTADDAAGGDAGRDRVAPA